MRATLCGVALTLGSLVVAVEPAAAAGPCSVNLTRTTPGGYVVKTSCSSPNAFIDGYGSTTGDANREALLLRQFQNNTGTLCSGNLSRAAVGGFEVKLSCSSPSSFVDAYGTTLTDAAREARLLKEIAPGRHCGHSLVRAVSGGYEVKGSCSKPTVFFSGVGPTVTQAAENARLSSGVG
ncbi:hypothetical protein [Lentzea aerocolonigenes]|uniref:hypothetical protein n=1 Tax=Lentzea aerocolonigenes TaxID=68170 RepID=UPI0004C30F28|nr:hypothetical protein [Lentzea aerocolonigenes]MCP2251072.1 hypothetical protein [Lentzea aerocolonigenes]